ncbi:MAG: PrsW family glutamic-type intramembrane protease [Patescibacteria group bacterium]
MASITYPLLFLFALAPSFIWLAFYLHKDSHPEPNRTIFKIFFLGMFIAIPAIYAETFFEGFFSAFSLPETTFLLFYFLFGIAFVEEFLKYLAVRFGVLANVALDEPLDVMLYMVVAGLGFAALENILLLFGLIQTYPISDVFLVNVIRFAQAVSLHALSSGLLGYFLALSLFWKKHRWFLTPLGFGLATLLHGFFNFYIFTIGGQNFILLLLPIVPLAAIAVLISLGFQELKTLWNKKSQ